MSNYTSKFEGEEIDARLTKAEEIDTLKTSKADKTEIPDISGLATQQELANGLNAKQETLQSGVNIKTVGGQSIMGGGDIEIPDATPVSGQTVLGGIYTYHDEATGRLFQGTRPITAGDIS